jgi:nitric oxide reductase subunit B
MYRKGERNHPNKLALFWTVGASIVSFIGAGLLGFAHTLPQTNLYTHGTLVTAMHGHMAFWGAYAMIVLAIISYSLPNMTGRKRYNNITGHAAFWITNIGMLGMTVAFGVAGVAQVYMERKMKMDFMEVQNEISIHFVVLIIMASLFTTGILMYIYEFWKYGKPTDEALESKDQ